MAIRRIPARGQVSLALALAMMVAGCKGATPPTTATATSPDPPALPADPPPPVAPTPPREAAPHRAPIKSKNSEGYWKELKVMASAYNSLPDQTSDTPFVAAWGDRLVPGSKVIAVSRDLLDMGLHHNSVVHISGLEGSYKVVDKMAARWTKTIDIYMGLDVQKAKDWGRRHVTIRWWVPAR